MRRVEVVEGLSVGFPGRDDAFTEGFEMGLLAAALATGAPEISLRFAPASLQQAQDLGRALGYAVFPDPRTGDASRVEVHFRSRLARPRLRVVV
jgi:hypothetical protein